MSIVEARLSPRVEAGFSSVPASNTRIVTLRNGHERRNANWSQRRRHYAAQLTAFNLAERQELLSVVHACDGPVYGFRFKDWLDFRAVGTSLGAAPAGSTPVQLTKSYAFGGRTHVRTITKPIAATLTVYQAGVAKAGAVDSTTGLFTPTTAWTGGAALTADFEFDVPVRFATDEIEFVLPHRDVADMSVELIEVFGE